MAEKTSSIRININSTDEEAQTLAGPLAPQHLVSRSAQHLPRIFLFSGLGVAIAVCIYILGATIGSSQLGSSACDHLSSTGRFGDSVAPEGPVSSNFEALHDYRGRPRSLSVRGGVVAADHGRCSEVGAAVLQDGGNAVDAAVATALCQGVYNPMASGIGGGHIMVIRLPDGSAEVIDARETAPLAASKKMFKGRPEAALIGGLAVAVPLELHGLYLAHTRHGVLPWARLVEPAAAVAESGFEAHPYLVSALTMANFTDFPLLQHTFMIQVDKVTWRPPAVNETCCKRPQLAQLLRDVAKQGPDVLYRGKYAAGLAEDIRAAGGIITEEDLQTAVAVVKQPLRTRVMGVEVIGPPPPSSAASILTALLVLSGYQLPLAGSGALGVHRCVEAMKHAFALRMSLGDPGSDPAAPLVPHLHELLGDMMSREYADSLRGMLNDSGVLETTAYGGQWNVVRGGVHPEDHGTSHMSVVDAQRMAVSLTTTVNTGFGSRVVSPSTGIILNNQMDDFSTPGQPNVYGLPPSPSNYIVPGKKPFSSMSPLVVERDGQLSMVLGASGGPRIISAVLQTLLRVLAYGEEPFSAVAGPRVHHQLVPEMLYAEAWSAGGAAFFYGNETLLGLEGRGHVVVRSAWGATVQAVVVNEHYSDGGGSGGSSSSSNSDNNNNNNNNSLEIEFTAVSDPRKDGAPAGF